MENTVLSIVLAIFASGGFWTFLQTLFQAKSKKNKAERILLLGLARSEIIRQGNELITNQSVSTNDFKEFSEFCDAYIILGGNGGGRQKYEEVKQKVSIQ